MKTQVKEKVGNLSNDLSELMVYVAELANRKKYVIKIDDEEQDHLEFIKFNTDLLTKTGKKKISKRINHLFKKSGYKSFNIFFIELKIRKVIDLNISIDVCEKERLIQTKRKKFLDVRNYLEKVRLDYIREKGDYYKLK